VSAPAYLYTWQGSRSSRGQPPNSSAPKCRDCPAFFRNTATAESGCSLDPHRRSLSDSNRLGGFVLVFDGLHSGSRGLRSRASSSKIRPGLGDSCHWVRRAFLTRAVCGDLRHRIPSACRSFSVTSPIESHAGCPRDFCSRSPAYPDYPQRAIPCIGRTRCGSSIRKRDA
jgi:hypothetical protein